MKKLNWIAVTILREGFSMLPVEETAMCSVPAGWCAEDIEVYMEELQAELDVEAVACLRGEVVRWERVDREEVCDG